MCELARIRTIQKCVDYFKQEDPESDISYYRIRSMALRGEIPSFRNGNTLLINLDVLIEHFNSLQAKPNPNQKETFGKVKPLGKKEAG